MAGHRKKPSPVAEFSFNVNRAFGARCHFIYLIKDENVVECYILFLGSPYELLVNLLIFQVLVTYYLLVLEWDKTNQNK